MGLDMYLYRVTKLKESEVKEVNGYTVEDFFKAMPNAFFFYKDDFNSLWKGAIDVVPFLSEIKLIVSETDYKKIKEDHNVPVDAKLTEVGFKSPDTTVFVFESRDRNGESWDVDVTNADKSSKYVKNTEKMVLAANQVGIYYWRKAYDIEDEFYSRYDIENTGYHLVDPEEVRIIAKEHGDERLYDIISSVEEKLDDENERIFYHEWY